MWQACMAEQWVANVSLLYLCYHALNNTTRNNRNEKRNQRMRSLVWSLPALAKYR